MPGSLIAGRAATMRASRNPSGGAGAAFFGSQSVPWLGGVADRSHHRHGITFGPVGLLLFGVLQRSRAASERLGA